MKHRHTDTFHILVSPDKFKGSIDAPAAARAIHDGMVESSLSQALGRQLRVTTLPVADGGEGTVDVVVAGGATRRWSTARGPEGADVLAAWALHGRRAVIEVASTCRLGYVAPSPRSALCASTDGTGDLIKTALAAHADQLVIGIGGTASTDGGVGALRALGVRFLDARGTNVLGGGGALSTIRHIDASGLDPRLRHATVTVACDVAVPLCGPSGAAQLFSPQKGADTAAVRTLEEGLLHLAALIAADLGVDVLDVPWGGAGGGIAAGLHGVLGARFEHGIDLVADIVDLDTHMASADLVIVGEGSLDRQSLHGKAVAGVARRARARRIPVAAIAGRITLSADELAELGVVSTVSLADEAGSAEESMREPEHWLRSAGRILAGRLLDNEQIFTPGLRT